MRFSWLWSCSLVSAAHVFASAADLKFLQYLPRVHLLRIEKRHWKPIFASAPLCFRSSYKRAARGLRTSEMGRQHAPGGFEIGRRIDAARHGIDDRDVDP